MHPQTDSTCFASLFYGVAGGVKLVNGIELVGRGSAWTEGNLGLKLCQTSFRKFGVGLDLQVSVPKLLQGIFGIYGLDEIIHSRAVEAIETIRGV